MSNLESISQKKNEPAVYVPATPPAHSKPQTPANHPVIYSEKKGSVPEGSGVPTLPAPDPGKFSQAELSYMVGMLSVEGIKNVSGMAAQGLEKMQKYMQERSSEQLENIKKAYAEKADAEASADTASTIGWVLTGLQAVAGAALCLTGVGAPLGVTLLVGAAIGVAINLVAAPMIDMLASCFSGLGEPLAHIAAVVTIVLLVVIAVVCRNTAPMKAIGAVARAVGTAGKSLAKGGANLVKEGAMKVSPNLTARVGEGAKAVTAKFALKSLPATVESGARIAPTGFQVVQGLTQGGLNTSGAVKNLHAAEHQQKALDEKANIQVAQSTIDCLMQTIAMAMESLNQVTANTMQSIQASSTPMRLHA